MITQTKESQAKMTPESSLSSLMAGNARFLVKEATTRDSIAQVTQTATGQYPFATVLSCIDSRMPIELIFDQGIGDLFSARIAGNFVNVDILGSLEFACKIAGSKVLMVLGHTSCGAVKGACDNAQLGNLTHMLSHIMPAVDAVKTGPGEDRNSSNLDFVNKVSAQNVQMTITEIKEKSPVLKELVDTGQLMLVGAMYDVATGRVRLI